MLPPVLGLQTPSPPLIDTYRAGDEVGIVACLRATFGDDAHLERWRHLHVANPAGGSVIVVARDGEAIVGQIANLRRRLRFFGATHTVVHVVDTMVHPSWQQRGVFQRLVGASEQQLAAQALHVSYGVANDVAVHGSIKYEQRKPLGAFPVLVRPLRPLASLAALARHHLQGSDTRPHQSIPECTAAGPLGAPDGASLGEAGTGTWKAPAFDQRHTDLHAHAEGLPPIGFVRDAEYLAWRYPPLPNSPYVQRDLVVGRDIAATAVVRMIAVAGLRLVLVMEWHWRNGSADAGRALAEDILVLARGVGAHGIAAMAARGTSHRRTLQSLKFLAVPTRAFPQPAWPGVHARGPEADDPRWAIGSNWYFTWGDGLVL